jgi:colanic acid/amylovoran biosynthesis glycosyltransferase
VGGKVITTFYGYDVSSYLKARGDEVYRELFNKGDLFLCVSDQMGRKLERLGCDKRKLRVHRLGLEMKDIESRQSSSHERLRILTIGRFVEKKGLPYAIQAVAKVLKKYPHVVYEIAGDGALRNELQCLIEKLQVSSNVRLLGAKRQDQVLQLFREAHLFLAPSVTGEDGDEEGIPTTIVEAFAHGLPVISTMHSGIPEIVQDGESGFLVPERDVDALAEKIEYLIERPWLRDAMGHKGRMFVHEHHDIDKLNDRLVALYRNLSVADDHGQVGLPCEITQ